MLCEVLIIFSRPFLLHFVLMFLKAKLQEEMIVLMGWRVGFSVGHCPLMELISLAV
jgi:hypothetical protein